MLNFVICDDNPNILDKFSKILEGIFIKHNYDAQIGLKTTDTDILLDYIDENRTDVLFLDINLKANTSGLEIASKVKQIIISIINTRFNLAYFSNNDILL